MTTNEVANPNKVVMILLGEAIRRGAISVEKLIAWAKEGQFPAKDWDDFRILCGREKKLPASDFLGSLDADSAEDMEEERRTVGSLPVPTTPPEQWAVYCLRMNFSWFVDTHVDVLGAHYEEVRPQGNARYTYQLIDESRKLAFATEA